MPAAGSDGGFGRRRGLGEYLLYLGRIDVWKGIPELVEHFARYRRERAPELSLVLAGSLHMKAPKGAGVLLAGYLEEGEKQQALAEALATVVPSSFESLSVVALESWAAGTPVVATARSRAVAGQCERSGGGLLYTSYEQFAAAVDRARSPERRALGESGRRFVATECSWERILGVYRRAIDRARGAPA